MRVAVLDLGTNTFNLIIADKNGEESFQILYNHKLPVKLGEGRINEGEIIKASFERGINAISAHYIVIKQYNPDKIKAYGTSALRTAQNGSEFISAIKKNTGIEVEIITGDLEAELIYYGVRQTLQMGLEKHLILDIGGGSNEFIIANSNEIFWKKSYPLGIARLLEKFKPSDPITVSEIEKIERYLKQEMKDLFNIVMANNIKTLLGASGSFETFAAMIRSSNDEFETEAAMKAESFHLSNHDFNNLFQVVIRSTINERRKMKGLEPMRVEMIVLACLFVKLIVEKLGISTIIQSNFSLKEGAVYHLIKN